MKNLSQANRGKSFESFIEYTNRAYRTRRVAIIEKQYVEMLPIRNGAGKVVACKVGEKSTVDYIGRFGWIPIAVEAKNTKTNSIRFDAVQDHQAQFLQEFTTDGNGVGIVLVSFDLKKFYAVPAEFWLAARRAWRAAQREGKKTAEKITITKYGHTWTTPGKASVRPEELLPEWECHTDYQYGIHYLRDAEKYITPRP